MVLLLGIFLVALGGTLALKGAIEVPRKWER